MWLRGRIIEGRVLVIEHWHPTLPGYPGHYHESARVWLDGDEVVTQHTGADDSIDRQTPADWVQMVEWVDLEWETIPRLERLAFAETCAQFLAPQHAALAERMRESGRAVLAHGVYRPIE